MDIHYWTRFTTSLLLITTTLFLLTAVTVQAVDYTVSTINDELDGSPSCLTGSSSDCSLREAITESNASGEPNVITIPEGTYTFTLSGADNLAAVGDLDINEGVTLNGAGALSTIIDAAGLDRAFEIRNGSEVYNFNDMTITGGSVTGQGGGIQNLLAGQLHIDGLIFTDNTASSSGGGLNSSGTTTINNTTFDSNTAVGGGALRVSGAVSAQVTDSTFSNNTSVGQRGGGIWNQAYLYLNNSTISGNIADHSGGGIFENGLGFLMANTTITGNTADYDNDGVGDGGGIFSDSSSSSPVLNANIIAGNTTLAGTGPDCAGSNAMATDKYNILGDSTGCTSTFITGADDQVDVSISLGSLVDRGGDTQVHTIPNGSIAHDQIPTAECQDTSDVTQVADQRGLSMSQGTTCDIGSYEVDATDPVVTVTGSSASLECKDTYADSGATATDNVDGTVTVTTDSSGVDTDAAGSYTINYSAMDSDSNEGTGTRTVTITDTADPIVTLTGDSSVTVDQGDTYTDTGATATDGCEGTLTPTTSDTVDTDTEGTYTVTYTATDSSSNSATATRTVIVAESTQVATSVKALKNNRVKVTYEDSSTTTFTLFSKGSAKPKVQLSSDGYRVVGMKKNGKTMVVIDANTGKKLASKTVNKKKQTFSKLYVQSYYSNSKNEVFALTKKNNRVTVTMFTLKSNSKLKIKQVKKITGVTGSNIKLVKKKKKAIVKKKKTKLQTYTVTKKGKLKN